MKKLLLILLCLPMIGFGQDDMIIFSSGDTIIGKVIEVGVYDITYQHKGENINYNSKKREIAKVIFSSGRIENFQGLSSFQFKISQMERKKKYINRKAEKKKNRIHKQKQKQKQINDYFQKLNSKNIFVISPGFSMTYINDGKDVPVFEEYNTLGITVSLDGFFPINKRLALDASIRFSQKNIKSTTGFSYFYYGSHYGDYGFLNKVNFIDVNPNISFKPIKRIAISFGPYIGYAINGKREIIYVKDYDIIPPELGFIYPTVTPEYDSNVDFNYSDDSRFPSFNNRINRLDYGLNIGIHYNLTKKVILNTEYSIGLSNLFSYTRDESATYTDINGNVIYSVPSGTYDYTQKVNLIYFTIGYIIN
jgi:hypothetical protein